MKIEDRVFRSWHYLQMGWQVYFSIIFAFINFITLMYTFIINDYEFLKNIFLSYVGFAIFFSMIVFTICAVLGFKHFKSAARRAEIDVNYETNRYFARKTVNSEMILKTYLILGKLLIKIKKYGDVQKNDIENFSEEINSIKNILNSRTMSNNLDIKYLKTQTEEN